MAIQRRFSAYDDGGLKNITADVLQGLEQVGVPILDSIKETSNSSAERSNAPEGFVNCVDICKPVPQKEACDDASGSQPSYFVQWDRQADDVALILHKPSHLPDSAVIFFDTIKKNRLYQKLIRSKMMQMESRTEQLRKLIERVKILKDFQVACKKRIGRALSQKKDARMQLISKRKLTENFKVSDKKSPVICKGPPGNPHVANYRQAMTAFGISICRKNWSKEEKNLVKGVKQQFQGMLFQRSVDILSEEDGPDYSCNLDSVMLSIKYVEITPERIKSFLPKVNWEQLASMYVPGRTGEECHSRFLNFEDPLINNGPWTAMEDKNLLHIIQQRGLSNWIEISASLGTNRTPFNCLARYQRSLNAFILKREWTKEDDNQLRAAVENFGESNWQLVASVMDGRTGTQCSNRWLKTLHPAKIRVGKWTAEEDKKLKVAVTLFGPKTWRKVASCVPGRTQVQCRERWVNCLDPSLNVAEWNDEEDRKLEAAIAEHGFCWSKVVVCIPHRTDNQCWRRWKSLYLNDVPRFQEARKIQKAALISNFVDRENERPALRPIDFVMSRTLAIKSKSQKKKRKTISKEANVDIVEGDLSRENFSDEIAMLTNRSDIENSSSGAVPTKRCAKRTRSKKNQSQLVSDMALLEMPTPELNSADEFNCSKKLQPRRRRIESDRTSDMIARMEPENQIVKQTTVRILTSAQDTYSYDRYGLVYLDVESCTAKDTDADARDATEATPCQQSGNIDKNATSKVSNDCTVFERNSDEVVCSLSGNTDASFFSQMQNGKKDGDDSNPKRKRKRQQGEVRDDATLSEFCSKIKKRK